MSRHEEPPFIEVIMRRQGVAVTANVEILDGWVADHDELGEVAAMAAASVLRQAIRAREAKPEPF